MKLSQSRALIPIKVFKNLISPCKTEIAIEISVEISMLDFPKWDSQITTSLLELVMFQKIADKCLFAGMPVK